MSQTAKSFLPPTASPKNRRSTDRGVKHPNQTRRTIGVAAARATGTGFDLGGPIEDGDRNTLSNFNLCDSTEDLNCEMDKAATQQKIKRKTFQTVQDQKNRKFYLAGRGIKPDPN